MKTAAIQSIPSLHWGFLLFIGLALVYFYKHRSQVVFLNVATLVVASQTLIGGGILCYNAAFDREWCDLSQTQVVCTVLGGMAVIWNSCAAIKKIIKKPV